MKKIIFLPTLFLSLSAGSGHASDAACNDSIESDRSINYAGCTDAQMSARANGQPALSRFAVTSSASSKIGSQDVLCSQCHQSSMKMSQGGSASPHEQSAQDTSGDNLLNLN